MQKTIGFFISILLVSFLVTLPIQTASAQPEVNAEVNFNIGRNLISISAGFGGGRGVSVNGQVNGGYYPVGQGVYAPQSITGDTFNSTISFYGSRGGNCYNAVKLEGDVLGVGAVSWYYVKHSTGEICYFSPPQIGAKHVYEVPVEYWGVYLNAHQLRAMQATRLQFSVRAWNDFTCRVANPFHKWANYGTGYQTGSTTGSGNTTAPPGISNTIGVKVPVTITFDAQLGKPWKAERMVSRGASGNLIAGYWVDFEGVEYLYYVEDYTPGAKNVAAIVPSNLSKVWDGEELSLHWDDFDHPFTEQ